MKSPCKAVVKPATKTSSAHVEKMPPKTVLKGEGRGHAYARLRQRILSMDLGPGCPLDETTIGLELGVSRTPMREAFVRLAAEGLVELHPNRGARVAPLELRQLQEHLEAFELLQRSVTVLAAQRRNDEDLARIDELCSSFEPLHAANDVPGMVDANWAFHHAIGVASGNRYLERMYDTVLTDSLRVARLAMAYECYSSAQNYNQHMQNILDEHRGLVKAIRERDVERAAKLSDSHSDLARLRVSEYLSHNLTRTIEVPGQIAKARVIHV